VIQIRPIGTVASPLTAISEAPKQGDEGAPDAWIELDPAYLEALDGVEAGDELVVVTWLDRADRGVLAVHPRNDASRPLTGVFATRSPHRPNPIGLHTVEVAEIDGPRLRVRNLEALDGTPVVDLKSTLRSIDER
jgi:tRNA-Thr(GGU) m(6)t(6)A37 methyltransferase TsaA